MAGVFLSHSSKDKPFAIKLAADLVSRGIPVWLDSWEMETGDSIYQRLFAAIDKSTFLILALSPNSVQSRWVRDELAAGLEKESKLGRKVIIPVKLAGCDAPEAIKDRVHADFTTGYLNSLESLELLLKREGAASAPVLFQKELVPLVFTKGRYLDVIRFATRVEHLASQRRDECRFVPEQFLVVSGDTYETARGTFLEFLDNYPKLDNYHPQTHHNLTEDYNSARKGEHALINGIAALANAFVQSGNPNYLYTAADWFSRLVRSEILARFGYSPGGLRLIVNQAEPAARFFEVEEVLPCSILRRGQPHFRHVTVWIDRDSELARWLRNSAAAEYRAFSSLDLTYKFVVPQVIARHYWFDPPTPLLWDLETSSDWIAR